MKHIDEALLETDIQQRYDFLSEFIGFGPDDVKLIQQAAMHIGPKIGRMVEKTYERLMAFDATARHFVPRQHGYEGPVPSGVEELTATHPQIQFRKDHLNRYFLALIGRSYDAKMVLYLDMVGKMHTPKAGSPLIDVPLVQMNALMGLLSDILTQTLIESPLDQDRTYSTIRAFQKLLWIQNDFINRHYANETVAAE
ncbi:MAG: protoglobin family protein [Planctomycetaceae bacterium]